MEDIENIFDSLVEGVELLQRSIQCSICLEVLKDPVSTRCYHTFCKECIMTVVDRNRIAHCPLCNKPIKRRAITEDQKIVSLVGKVQKVLDGIGKDTGYDITGHFKLPASSREAFVASPKFRKEKEVAVKTQIVCSPEKFIKPPIPNKEQYLKRYEKQYQAKSSSDEEVDLLSISQVESVIPTYMPLNKKLLAVKKNVDKVKVPPTDKVQEWLEKNDDVDEAEAPLSPLTEDSVTQAGNHIITVTADVHKPEDDYPNLLSVSQTQSNFYIAPRKTDIKTMKCSSDETSVKKSSEKVFTSKLEEDKIEVADATADPAKATVEDPYEFISSQNSYKPVKKKRNTRGKGKLKKMDIKSVKTYRPSMKRNVKNKIFVHKDVESQTQSETTFIFPVDVNNTFDKLIVETHKNNRNRMEDVNKNKFEPLITKEMQKETDVDNNTDEDVQLFRTPMDSCMLIQRHEDEDSMTETMSDVDFSSGSDEDWGETHKVNVDTMQTTNKRVRKCSSNKEPSKKIDTEGSFRRRTRSKSREKPQQLTPLEKWIVPQKKDSVKHNIETMQNRKVVASEKRTPLSPSRKLNQEAIEIVSKSIAVADKIIEKRPLPVEKSLIDKENLLSPLEKVGVQNTSVVNTTLGSRSPGWSRISKSKKDFEVFKKPILKALDVSGGEAHLNKKSATANSTLKKANPVNTTISPVPTIDDNESNVSVMSTEPVVAFHSPEASNRAKMMSKIVKDLETEIGPDTSVTSMKSFMTSESITPDRKRPGSHLGIVPLQKDTSFCSLFSRPSQEESPTSSKRKEQIKTIVSALEKEEEEIMVTALTQKPDTMVQQNEISKETHNTNINNTIQTILEAVNSFQNDIPGNETPQGGNLHITSENSDVLNHETKNTGIERLCIQNKIIETSGVTTNSVAGTLVVLESAFNTDNIAETDDRKDSSKSVDITHSVAVIPESASNTEFDNERGNTFSSCQNEPVVIFPENSDVSQSDLKIVQPKTKPVDAVAENTPKSEPTLLQHRKVSKVNTVSSVEPVVTQKAVPLETENIKSISNRLPQESKIHINMQEIQKSTSLCEYSSSEELNIRKSSSPCISSNLNDGEVNKMDYSSKIPIAYIRRDGSTIHIPFIKCGSLNWESKTVNVKFLLLGSLAPCKHNIYVQTTQEEARIVPNSPSQMNVTLKPLVIFENRDASVQTSPKLGNPLHNNLQVSDVKALTTPTTDPKFAQFNTPVWSNDLEVHSENFVPDSSGDGVFPFPSAITLPHQRSSLWEDPAGGDKLYDVESSVMSPICDRVEPLHIDPMAVENERDKSLENGDDLNETVVLKPPNCYRDTVEGDFCVPISQFSTATTIKFHKQASPCVDLKKVEELATSSNTESNLSVSLLQSADSQQARGSNINPSGFVASNKLAYSQNENNSGECVKQQQIQITNEKERTSEDNIKSNTLESASSSKKSGLSSSKRLSRASRQLKFSPYTVPKLTDPNQDSTDDKPSPTLTSQKEEFYSATFTSQKEKFHSVSSEMSSNSEEGKRKSFKRIRTPSASSDSGEVPSKKPCSTSNSEERLSSENSDVNMVEDDEVIDLLTSADKTNKSFEKENFEKWLNSSAPDSEELMEKVMANIDADLAETRKRKTREEELKKSDSPTLFTPPPAVGETEEEFASGMTFELIVSQTDCQQKTSLERHCRNNTVPEAEMDEHCSQEKQQIKDGRFIGSLESNKRQNNEIQKTQENQTPVDSGHKTVFDSENESDDDLVEPTPRKDETTNKTWECKNKEDSKVDVDSVKHVAGKSSVETSEITSKQSPVSIQKEEDQSKHMEATGYKCTHVSSTDSHLTPPAAPKQFVLRVPSAGTRNSGQKSASLETSNPPMMVNVNNSARISNPHAQVTPKDQPTPKTVPSATKAKTSLVVDQVARTEKLCFVCSGLPAGLIARVQALANMVGAEFSSKFESHTTHLVVKASPNMTADKTYKYLAAVVKRIWIVSISWVNHCLQAKKLLPEDEYEMLDSSGDDGPHRSRISTVPLFGNFEFCCIGPFTDLTQDQFQEMLRECGAATVSSPDKFSFKPGQHSMILVQVDADIEEECKDWWKKYGVLPIGHEWVFECIGRYKIVPLWQFLMCPVSEDHIRALGYPEDALASDDETEVDSQTSKITE